MYTLIYYKELGSSLKANVTIQILWVLLPMLLVMEMFQVVWIVWAGKEKHFYYPWVQCQGLKGDVRIRRSSPCLCKKYMAGWGRDKGNSFSLSLSQSFHWWHHIAMSLNAPRSTLAGTLNTQQQYWLNTWKLFWNLHRIILYNVQAEQGQGLVYMFLQGCAL